VKLSLYKRCGAACLAVSIYFIQDRVNGRRFIGRVASIRSVRRLSSALVKDAAQMLAEKPGAPPLEATCAARP
jgi:hypothetical protein